MFIFAQLHFFLLFTATGMNIDWEEWVQLMGTMTCILLYLFGLWLGDYKITL